MAMYISSNVSSIAAQNNLSHTNRALASSISRLSSGSRIVNAVDDPAGLAISDRLRMQITAFNQMRRNANDGISALQVADGGLNEISNILVRMRELATQASNGTLSSGDRSNLQTEFNELKSEIDRISEAMEFNKVKLLNGALASGTGSLALQVGLLDATTDRISINIANMASNSIGKTSTGTTNLGAAAVSISLSGEHARKILAIVDQAIDDVSTERATIGAKLSRLNATVNNLALTEQNLMAANSRIRDVDVAEETARMTRNQILVQAGVSVLAQANQAPQAALSLLG